MITIKHHSTDWLTWCCDEVIDVTERRIATAPDTQVCRGRIITCDSVTQCTLLTTLSNTHTDILRRSDSEWVNERGDVCDRQTDRPRQMWKMTHLRRWNLFDDICRIGRWSFWSWLSRSIFTKICAKTIFTFSFPFQWPWHLTYLPVTSVHDRISTKFKVSTTLHTRVTRSHGTDRRTDRQTERQTDIRMSYDT